MNKIENSEDLKNEIVRLIMAGETISNICERPHMPGRTTVHRWLMNDKEFNEAYRNAAHIRAQDLVTESLEIADRPKKTIKDVAADRLRITTRLKLAAVLNPRLFSGWTARKASGKKSRKRVEIHVVDHGSDVRLPGQDSDRTSESATRNADEMD